MKFLVFSDFHYYPNRYMNPGFEGLRKLQKAAEETGTLRTAIGMHFLNNLISVLYLLLIRVAGPYF